MAIGILATCRQVHQEAALLFWQDNTFLFSGDFDWFGLRSFLATIGPRAISRLRILEVFIPLDEVPVKYDDQTNEDEYDMSSAAKNTPKLQMAKVSDKERDLETNIPEVCFLLDAAKGSTSLHCILPNGFYVDEDQQNLWWLAEVLEQLQHSLDISVIVEPGGILDGVETPGILTDAELDVFCMPESIWI